MLAMERRGENARSLRSLPLVGSLIQLLCIVGDILGREALEMQELRL